MVLRIKKVQQQLQSTLAKPAAVHVSDVTLAPVRKLLAEYDSRIRDLKLVESGLKAWSIQMGELSTNEANIAEKPVLAMITVMQKHFPA